MSLSLALWSQRQIDFCEFRASLVYRYVFLDSQSCVERLCLKRREKGSNKKCFFMLVYVCLHEFVHIICVQGLWGPEERSSMWVLGTESLSSARVVGSLNHRAISASLPVYINTACCSEIPASKSHISKYHLCYFT